MSRHSSFPSILASRKCPIGTRGWWFCYKLHLELILILLMWFYMKGSLWLWMQPGHLLGKYFIANWPFWGPLGWGGTTMWVKRHGEEFSLCNWQLLLKFKATVFNTKCELWDPFIFLRFRGFNSFRWLDVLMMGVEWEIPSNEGWSWFGGQGGQKGDFGFWGVDWLEFALELQEGLIQESAMFRSEVMSKSSLSEDISTALSQKDQLREYKKWQWVTPLTGHGSLRLFRWPLTMCS